VVVCPDLIDYQRLREMTAGPHAELAVGGSRH
jgi:hypothetical protein